MDLRDFISQALCDIVNGVRDAQKSTDPGIIVPACSATFQALEAGITGFTPIEFEVNVRTDKKAGSEAKLNVVVAVVGGGVKGESGKQ